MIEALKKLGVDFIWTHLGDGALRGELETLVKKLNLEDSFIFLGFVNSEKVLDVYKENVFDVFVNVSESEGVPFSIMEAMSVGIPVIATDAGGTKEIVDEKIGHLLPNAVTPDILAKELAAFHNLSHEDKLQRRDTSYNRYLEMCDAKKLANELGTFLTTQL